MTFSIYVLQPTFGSINSITDLSQLKVINKATKVDDCLPKKPQLRLRASEARLE